MLDAEKAAERAEGRARAPSAAALGPADDDGENALTARIRSALRAALTIKIGSALLVDGDGQAARDWLADLAADIAALRRRAARSSSSPRARSRSAAGCSGSTAVALTLEQSQAAASAGQIALSQAWAECARASTASSPGRS